MLISVVLINNKKIVVFKNATAHDICLALRYGIRDSFQPEDLVELKNIRCQCQLNPFPLSLMPRLDKLECLSRNIGEIIYERS